MVVAKMKSLLSLSGLYMTHHIALFEIDQKTKCVRGSRLRRNIYHVG